MPAAPATIGPVGVIGLGLVGRALAARALAAGIPVQGCDPDPAARDAAAALGVGIVADVAALARAAPILVVCVFDDQQFAAVSDAVSDVVAVADGPAVSLVVNTATCSPSVIDWAVRRLDARGIAFIEMPLSGSSAQIRDGRALALVGAQDAVFARWESLLAVLGPTALRVGPPGAAARAKLASNLILGLNRAALAEGLALAEALGLDGHRFLELLRRSPAYSRAVDSVGDRMVARDFRPQSRLAQHRKDLALILAEGAACAQPLPLASAHAELLDRAIGLGLGDRDNAAVFAALRPH